MIVSVENKRQKVIDLRGNGLTLSEISRELGLPKGTISRWLRGVNFSRESLLKISSHSAENRLRGLSKSKLTKSIKSKFNQRNSLIEAKKIFEKLKRDPFFISGLALYWAHGSFKNKYFQFTSGDSEKINFMLGWLKKYQKISLKETKYRLFCYQPLAKDSSAYWQKILGQEALIRTTFLRPRLSKNVENKGVLQILVYDISLVQKMLFWQKLFVEYYKSV